MLEYGAPRTGEKLIDRAFRTEYEPELYELMQACTIFPVDSVNAEADTVDRRQVGVPYGMILLMKRSVG